MRLALRVTCMTEAADKYLGDLKAPPARYAAMLLWNDYQRRDTHHLAWRAAGEDCEFLPLKRVPCPLCGWRNHSEAPSVGAYGGEGTIPLRCDCPGCEGGTGEPDESWKLHGWGEGVYDHKVWCFEARSALTAQMADVDGLEVWG